MRGGVILLLLGFSAYVAYGQDDYDTGSSGLSIGDLIVNFFAVQRRFLKVASSVSSWLAYASVAFCRCTAASLFFAVFTTPALVICIFTAKLLMFSVTATTHPRSHGFGGAIPGLFDGGTQQSAPVPERSTQSTIEMPERNPDPYLLNELFMMRPQSAAPTTRPMESQQPPLREVPIR